MTSDELVMELNRIADLVEKSCPESIPDGQQWIKENLPKGHAVLAEVESYLWDCPAVKGAVDRSSQTFAQANESSFKEDLVADFRNLAAAVAGPKRIPRKGIKFSKASSLRQLRDILIEYTSGGGMAAWGHIDKAKKMLERWQMENKHPLVPLLLDVQADLPAAEMWLKEVEAEMDATKESTSLRTFVVFVDVVAYSLKPIERQLEIVNALTEAVRDKLAKTDMQQDEDYVALPTGDGMAICLLGGDASRTAELGMAIMKAVVDDGLGFQIRMGLHTAEDRTYSDINGRINVAGAGINWAARVMGKAASGQILVSYALGQLLDALAQYKGRLRSVGIKEVKHGKREEMFELALSSAKLPSQSVQGQDVEVSGDPPTSKTAGPSVRFEKIMGLMPDLIAEFKRDLSAEGNRTVREFFVLPNKRVALGGSSKRRFIYYESQHDDLRGKLDILENDGWIFDVTVRKAPIFRFAEEFVEEILRS